MAVDQDEVTRALAVLSHPLRRQILSALDGKGELSFTDIMTALDIDTGKLSFHIRNLSGFIEQSPTGKYKLTRTGEHAIELLRDLETWVTNADGLRKNPMSHLANFNKRAFAFLIDFALILAVFVIPGVSASLLTGSGLGVTINDLILFLVIFWVYCTLLEGFAGQSLGKRIVRLMVVRTDGKKPSYDHAAVRNFGKILPVLPFDLLIGFGLKDKRFIRYFDKFAGTTVIDLEPQAKTSETAKSDLQA